jgi:hypothetical protein
MGIESFIVDSFWCCARIFNFVCGFPVLYCHGLDPLACYDSELKSAKLFLLEIGLGSGPHP